MVTVMFMAKFDFTLCNAAGEPMTETPLIDRNLAVVERPSVPFRLKCTLRRY